MPIAVVLGAKLQCTCGSAPGNLTVTSQMLDLIEHKPAATIADHKPGANIPTFGTCSSLSGPCAPATPAPWLPGSGTMVVIDNNLALRHCDKLACTNGGMISIVDPGQASTFDT